MPTTNHENVLNHFIGALFCNSFFLLWFCGFWLANMLLQNTLKLRLLAKCLKHRSRVKKYGTFLFTLFYYLSDILMVTLLATSDLNQH